MSPLEAAKRRLVADLRDPEKVVSDWRKGGEPPDRGCLVVLAIRVANLDRSIEQPLFDFLRKTLGPRDLVSVFAAHGPEWCADKIEATL